MGKLKRMVDEIIEEQRRMNRWLDDPGAPRWCEMAAELEANANDDKPEVVPDMGEAIFVGARSGTLSNPFGVTDDMFTLVDAASRHEEWMSEPLLATDFVLPNGFVKFPRPYVSTEMLATGEPEDKLPLGGFSWALGYHTSDGEITTDIADPELANVAGFILYADTTSTRLESLPHWPKMLPSFISTMSIGTTPFGGQQADSWWKLVHSFLRISSQSIASVSVVEGTRSARNKRRRIPHFNEPKDVRIVSLRRRRPREPEARGTSWQLDHRILVDGFWRNQWYPSIEEHRRIWIAPHLRGPEGSELRVHRNAYALVR